jgi:molybdate transport system permease protein
MLSLPDLFVPPLVSALVATIIGLKAAGLRARGAAPWLFAVDVLFLFPALIPAPVLAGLLRPLLGGAHDPAWLAILIAMAIVSIPLAYLPARIVLCRLNATYRDTIRILGMGMIQRSLRIDLPLGWPAMLLGALLAFTRVLGEVVATIGALDRVTMLTVLLLILAAGSAFFVTRGITRTA